MRHLRHHGKSRHNKAYQEKRGKIPIPNKIHDRPREADNRVEIGHWEGDRFSRSPIWILDSLSSQKVSTLIHSK